MSREIDERVAREVMGWEVEYLSAYGRIPQVRARYFDTPQHWPEPQSHRSHRNCPEFSTDIAAAWEVVSKMMDWSFKLSGGERFGDHWFAEFVDNDGQYRSPEVGCKTPMMAICLAALEAVSE